MNKDSMVYRHIKQMQEKLTNRIAKIKKIKKASEIKVDDHLAL